MATNEARHRVKVWQFPAMTLEHYVYAPGPPDVLAKHAHEEYQIGLSLNFPGVYEYRGTTSPVPAGSLSIIHPGEMHAARDLDYRHNSAEFRMMYISPDLMNQATDNADGCSVSLPFFATPIIRDSRLTTLFLTLHRTFTEALASQLQQDSLLHGFLTKLIRERAQVQPKMRSLSPNHRAVTRARDYLHAHYGDNVSLHELAQIAGMSPFHLTRVFRRALGLPPHLYQVQVRIARAKQLLARGLPTVQVAAETGFYDQSHFGWHFKRLVGVTPARYIGERKNFLDVDF